MWFVVASHTFFYFEHFWNLILWFAVVIYLPKILNQQSSLSSSTAVDISHLRRRKKQQIEHPTGTHNWIRTSLFLRLLLRLLFLSLQIRWDWKIFRISFFVTRIFWVFVYFSISFGKNFVEHTTEQWNFELGHNSSTPDDDDDDDEDPESLSHNTKKNLASKYIAH